MVEGLLPIMAWIPYSENTIKPFVKNVWNLLILKKENVQHCGHNKFVKGVADRIAELSEASETVPERPPYIYQIPLEFIPGLGPKLREKLLNHFGTEMAILHEVSFDHLKEVVPEKIAKLIVAARTGQLKLEAGGGGKYGRDSKRNKEFSHSLPFLSSPSNSPQQIYQI